MTMMPPAHPDPELLAALAGADPDAHSDRELRAHVQDCATCQGQVHEIAALRAALAELPDLAPPRPLRLLPPVPEAAPTGPAGWRIALRRAFAPMAVAGMVLLLIGGVGATGALGPADPGTAFRELSFSSPTEQAAAEPEVTGTDGRAAPDSGEVGALAPSSSPPPSDAVAAPENADSSRGAEDTAVQSRGGWLVVGLVGIGLLVLALVLRRSAVPADRD